MRFQVHTKLRALSFGQNWPAARPVSLQRKCNNLKEHLHDNPSNSSGVVYTCIILEVGEFEGVVQLIFSNAWSGQSVLSNRKRPKSYGLARFPGQAVQ